MLTHTARTAARLFRQFGREGHSRTKRIGGGSRGGFHGGGSFRGGGLRGDYLSRLDGSVRAGRQDFRTIVRAALRHAEPLVCEPALAQGSPGFGFLSEYHGEVAAARGLE
jgi:hypothetical protein